MSSSARSEAALYHRRGWCPIPVKERSKATSLVQLAPYLKRRATREELNAWSWDGVGIVTGPLSGILVLDVDGPQGEARLLELGHPPTPMVRTARGGLHLYFKHPSGDVRTGIRVAPELDVKAAGGYVVAPPSLGPNGQRYEWLVSPEEAELADPPEWLLQLLERPRRNGAAPPVGKKIPPGRRNQELTSIAGTMRRRGMEQPEILAALKTANERRCDPPLDAEEVEKIASSVARYEPARSSTNEAPAGDVVHVSFNGNGSAAKVPPLGYNLTDLGNAERLVARHGHTVRYCHETRQWYLWDGRRWVEDKAGQLRHMARETVRQIGGEAPTIDDDNARKALLKWALASEAKTRIDAMIGLAEAEKGIPVTLDELDADPWKLNCANGTVDLRTGELYPHRPEDLITKLAPVQYKPGAHSRVWEKYLAFATGGDERLAGFLQRAAGYSLTGDVSEEVLFFIHGPAAAGKSTFLEALKTALGDYAKTADFEAFLARRDTGGVRNDIARLAGARLVASIEVDEGKRLAEGLIKMLTGGDRIAARFLYKEAFEFLPTFKLWLAANHKPKIDPDDEAMWRRVLQVPFDKVVAKGDRDPAVKKALRDPAGAGAAVLAWAVQGCLSWQREGLGIPPAVEAATERYREEMDPLQDFVEDCCVVSPDAWTATGHLRQAYEAWGRETGTRNLVGPKKFGERLRARGCVPKSDRLHGKVVRGWSGIGLRADVDTLADVDANFSNSASNNNSSREVGESGVNKRQRVNVSEEQARRIRELVGQGWSEYAARVEVLAKDHPPGCSCKVCS